MKDNKLSITKNTLVNMYAVCASLGLSEAQQTAICDCMFVNLTDDSRCRKTLDRLIDAFPADCFIDLRRE